MKRVTHTHRGHCQRCGAVHAVSTHRGLIAKHGYDVQYNYFRGVCSGSDKLPLQKEFSYCELMQTYSTETAQRHEKVLATLKDGSFHPEDCRTGHRFDKTLRRSVDTLTPWESATELQRRDEIAKCIREHERAIEFWHGHAAFLKKLQAEIFGTELLPTVRPRELQPGDTVIYYTKEYTVARVEMKHRGWRMQAYVITTTGESLAKRMCKLKEG